MYPVACLRNLIPAALIQLAGFMGKAVFVTTKKFRDGRYFKNLWSVPTSFTPYKIKRHFFICWIYISSIVSHITDEMIWFTEHIIIHTITHTSKIYYALYFTKYFYVCSPRAYLIITLLRNIGYRRFSTLRHCVYKH